MIELSQAAKPTIAMQDPINENIFFLLSFVVYLNRFVQNISGEFLISAAKIKAQNAVIVISPFVSVCCVYYPKMVEMIPPTIIVVVATPSVTRQNVIIFFPPFIQAWLSLVSFIIRRS